MKENPYEEHEHNEGHPGINFCIQCYQAEAFDEGEAVGEVIGWNDCLEAVVKVLYEQHIEETKEVVLFDLIEALRKPASQEEE